MSSQTRQLGRNGPVVNAVGAGLMSLGHAYGNAGDTPTRLKFLDELFDLGVTHWDDSDIYADTEDVVGEWFTANPDKRRDVFLATKFGITAGGMRSDPEYVRLACERSLARLKTDYIDLYYCHRVDSVTPIEKTMEALVELKRQGKIRHIGLSEVSADTVRRACVVHHVDAVQMEYSPFALEIERPKKGQKSVLDTCRELGVAVVAYSPLGRGFLTGSIKSPEDMKDDWRGTVPTFAKEAFEKNMELVDAIKVVYEAKKKQTPELTQAQLVLGWVLRQWEHIIPIPGSRNIGRVRENIGSAGVQLTEEEDAAIRQAAESLKKVGDRYPEGWTSTLEADTAPL